MHKSFTVPDGGPYGISKERKGIKMKAQTKALVASLVVIALALSAVSGITYSWFSDTEKADITVSTAKVDYEVEFSLPTDAVNGVATLKKTENTATSFTLSGLAANVTAKIDAKITNNSTVKTVYQVILTPSYKAPGEGGTGFTDYDFKNILVQTASGNTTNLLSEKKTDAEGNITFGSIVIKDWTVVDAPGTTPADVTTVTTVITTPQEYGGTPEEPIVAFDSNGLGKTTKGDGDTAWDAKTKRTGLSFTLEVVAVQGDYPYKTMTKVSDSSEAVAATLPTNKVVSAAEIKNSTGDAQTRDVVKDVIVDFSNVTTVTTGTGSGASTSNVAGQKVTVKIDSITNTDTARQVSLTLALGEETDTSTTKTFDAPVVITMTVPGKIVDPIVKYNGDGEDGTVLSSTVNGSGEDATTTIVFSVKHFSEYTIVDTIAVTTSDAFSSALNDGGFVKLGANITIEEYLDFQAAGKYVIDLNGYTLNITGALIGYNGCTKHSTDDDSCEKEAATDVQGVNLIIKNGDLRTTTTSSTAAFKIGVGSSFEMDNVTYDAGTGSGIFPRGDSAKVVVKDSTITAGCYGIGTNASTSDNYNVVIRISGSKITTSSKDGDNTAVMINVDGTLYIYDSELKADRQCLIVRAGTAYVMDSTLNYTGSYSGANKETRETAWGEGNEVSMAAVVVGNMQNPDAYKAMAIFGYKNVTISLPSDSGYKAVLLAQDGANGQYVTIAKMTGEESSNFFDSVYMMDSKTTGPVKLDQSMYMNTLAFTKTCYTYWNSQKN